MTTSRKRLITTSQRRLIHSFTRLPNDNFTQALDSQLILYLYELYMSASYYDFYSYQPILKINLAQYEYLFTPRNHGRLSASSYASSS
jgi:hypothetical protein